MAILERMIVRVLDNKWDEVMAQEKEWEALEAKLGGFPKKRHYQGYTGSCGPDQLVIEREWESLSVYEATYMKLWGASETKTLESAGRSLKGSNQIELYGVID